MKKSRLSTLNYNIPHGPAGLQLVHGTIQETIKEDHGQARVCPISQNLSVYVAGSVIHSLLDMRNDEASSTLRHIARNFPGNKLKLGAVFPFPEYIPGNPTVYTLYAVTTEHEGLEGTKGYKSNSGTVEEATMRSLAIANSSMLYSMVFPILGAGLGGMPLEASLNAMLPRISAHFISSSSIRTIAIAVPDVKNFRRARNFLDRRLK